MDQWVGPIILLVPFLLLYLVFSRTRKQQSALLAVQSAIVPGSRVMTTSGLHATVVSVEDSIAVLEIAPGVRTRWARQAIAQIEAQDSAALEEQDSAPTDKSAPTAEDERPPG